MNIAKVVSQGLRKIFKLLVSEAVDIQFKLKNSSEFNFSTGDVVETLVNFNTKAIILSFTKSSESKNTIRAQILVSMEGLSSLTAFDVVTMKGENWKVGPIIRDDKFVSLLEIYKEST